MQTIEHGGYRMVARDVRELKVYRMAFEAAMRIFELSKAWPGVERYALVDQSRRSSRAVCAILAEAWRKRSYPAHFVSKLTDAHAEAEETLTWLAFANACHYLSERDHADLIERYDHICRMLSRMSHDPERWRPPSARS